MLLTDIVLGALLSGLFFGTIQYWTSDRLARAVAFALALIMAVWLYAAWLGGR